MGLGARSAICRGRVRGVPAQWHSGAAWRGGGTLARALGRPRQDGGSPLLGGVRVRAYLVWAQGVSGGLATVLMAAALAGAALILIGGEATHHEKVAPSQQQHDSKKHAE